MSQVDKQWKKGFSDGWDAQGTHRTTDPVCPPMPEMPDDVEDPEAWAYREGKARGVVNRLKKQAGLP